MDQSMVDAVAELANEEKVQQEKAASLTAHIVPLHCPNPPGHPAVLGSSAQLINRPYFW